MDPVGTFLHVRRKTLVTVAGAIVLSAVCALAAIAVNVSILHRTPTDPIGRVHVAPVAPAPTAFTTVP